MTEPEPTRDAVPGAAGRPARPESDDTREQPQPGAEPHSDAPESEQQPDDAVGREKRLRRRAQDAEGERDQLRGVVESYQRRDVESLAAERMLAPADLWTAGVALADVLDDHGAVDVAKVRDTVGRVLDERPHWARRTGPKPDPTQGARPDETRRRASWSDVISGRSRR